MAETRITFNKGLQDSYTELKTSNSIKESDFYVATDTGNVYLGELELGKQHSDNIENLQNKVNEETTLRVAADQGLLEQVQKLGSHVEDIEANSNYNVVTIANRIARASHSNSIKTTNTEKSFEPDYSWYSEDGGTEESPYEISSVRHMIAWSNISNATSAINVDGYIIEPTTFCGKHFVITKDINMGGCIFTPIRGGTYTSGPSYEYSPNEYFDDQRSIVTEWTRGVHLNGNGHTICGMIVDSYAGPRGLFSYLGHHSNIENLRFFNCHIHGSYQAGMVAGNSASHNMRFSNIFVDKCSTVNEGGNFAGGLVGLIVDQYFSRDGYGISVSSTFTMSTCVFEGTVTSAAARCGGLIASIHTSDKVTFTFQNCVFNGELVLTKSTGACGLLIGYLLKQDGSSTAEYTINIASCLLLGKVTPTVGLTTCTIYGFFGNCSIGVTANINSSYNILYTDTLSLEDVNNQLNTVGLWGSDYMDTIMAHPLAPEDNQKSIITSDLTFIIPYFDGASDAAGYNGWGQYYGCNYSALNGLRVINNRHGALTDELAAYIEDIENVLIVSSTAVTIHDFVVDNANHIRNILNPEFVGGWDGNPTYNRYTQQELLTTYQHDYASYNTSQIIVGTDYMSAELDFYLMALYTNTSDYYDNVSILLGSDLNFAGYSVPTLCYKYREAGAPEGGDPSLNGADHYDAVNFNGDNHTIRNLHQVGWAGLLGRVRGSEEGTSISGVNMQDCHFYSSVSIGALVSTPEPGVMILNCTIDESSTVYTSGNEAGGIVGYVNGKLDEEELPVVMSCCYSSAAVYSKSRAGGLVGCVQSCHFRAHECGFTGNIMVNASSSGATAAGILGCDTQDTEQNVPACYLFSSCFTDASITTRTTGGTVQIAGIHGAHIDSHSGTNYNKYVYENCHATTKQTSNGTTSNKNTLCGISCYNVTGSDTVIDNYINCDYQVSGSESTFSDVNNYSQVNRLWTDDEDNRLKLTSMTLNQLYWYWGSTYVAFNLVESILNGDSTESVMYNKYISNMNIEIPQATWSNYYDPENIAVVYPQTYLRSNVAVVTSSGSTVQLLLSPHETPKLSVTDDNCTLDGKRLQFTFCGGALATQ